MSATLSPSRRCVPSAATHTLPPSSIAFLLTATPFSFDAQLSIEELIKHALLALRETLSTGTDLTASNVAVGYCGLDGGFTILEDETIAEYVDAVKAEAGPATGGGEMETDGAAAEGEAAAAMDTDA